VAFPFAPAISVGDFIHRVCSELSGSVSFSKRTVNGESRDFRMLRRTVEGVVYVVPIDCEDSVRLLPSVLRSLCARLRIPPSHFKFNFHEPGAH